MGLNKSGKTENDRERDFNNDLISLKSTILSKIDKAVDKDPTENKENSID